MSSLLSLQMDLQSHLLVGDARIADRLKIPSKGVLDERLALYASAYYCRLVDALRKDYLLLHHYLGDEIFTDLCEAYIAECPSRFYSITGFTKQLPEFLAVHQFQHAYLSELAALLRALSLSLESADAPFVDHKTVSEIPLQDWPSLCFQYHPSVQCLVFQWNTFSIWKALAQKTAVPPMKKETSHCLVWRKELRPYANSLTLLEHLIFKAFQAGHCFSDVCEAVYSSGLSGEAEAAALLAHYISCGLTEHLFSEVHVA